jgi:hypothetical protein
MPDEPRIGEELRKIEREPLLPVEIRLIVWSLVIGVVLLVILVWLSGRFFPTTGGAG